MIYSHICPTIREPSFIESFILIFNRRVFFNTQSIWALTCRPHMNSFYASCVQCRYDRYTYDFNFTSIYFPNLISLKKDLRFTNCGPFVVNVDITKYFERRTIPRLYVSCRRNRQPAHFPIKT